MTPATPRATRNKTLLRRRGARDGSGRVALTFDDGPGPHTREVASVLDRHGVPGTFFVVGMEVVGREPELRRLADAGHELGNHSFDHSRDVGANTREAYVQIRRTNAVVEAATGTRPRLYRPPWGSVSSGVLLAARLAGMTTVAWNVDPRDWDGPRPAEIERRVLARIRGGGIVLLHDGGRSRECMIAALPGIVWKLSAAGYDLVTASELLAPGATRPRPGRAARSPSFRSAAQRGPRPSNRLPPPTGPPRSAG